MKTCEIRARAFVALWLFPAVGVGQAFNLDFGEPGNAPERHYAAAGLAGVWNSFPASHGTTTEDLLDVEGNVTAVSVRQLGGMETPTVVDPATTGDHSLLLDDYVVTFNAGLESCLFFENLEPGPYEVLLYAWMPLAPGVKSYTDVDQEPGNPHSVVGGVWGGNHEELVSFSRHLVVVAANGVLNMHSGIVPNADPIEGAALNGVQLRPWTGLFEDGFESGDTSAWTAVVE